jgi:transcriptional regulator with PAS, ATPase and Fis domain
VKLLRFLQEGESRRVGETRVQKFDVRIISATNRNLEEAVKEGVFREDLLFRLSVIPIYVPSLRERREDIALLATHLLQRLCDTHNRKVTGISSKTLKKLMDYDWRGNVRELENTIEYALHLTDDGQAIKNEQLPNKFWSNAENLGIPRDFISIDDYTKQTIIALQNNHTEEQIAATLGISRKNLWQKRKRWDISRVKTTN